MNEIVIFLIGLVVVAIVLVVFMVWKLTKRELSASVKKALLIEWKHVEKIEDNHRAVMDAEKVVDHAMRELGYTGTFADKLRSAGSHFSSVQSLWEAHKLRNRIAHEVGVQISAAQAKSSLSAFKRALNDLL